MKKTFISLILSLFTWVLFGQIPSGYYDSANGLSGEALRSALHDIIDGHSVISYNGLWNAYRTTDKKANGKVWDTYSNCDFTFGSDQCGSYSNICDCYNREHTVPQSWFNEASPMVSDIFHVIPTDGKVNGYRSSYPYGECENGTVYGLGKLGSSTTPGYTSTVFEPADEYKGDIARIYFYMATRYMDVLSGWGGASFSGNNLSVWTQNLMVNWHEQDPVSQKEIDRNNLIYSNFQHNRNPYVDHPEWVAEVWGVGNSVLDPQGFTAYAHSATQINLIWTLNNNSDNVLVAYNTVNSFGTPQIDNTISGNGTVLTHGQITTFEHTGLSAQNYFYKIWSKNSAGEFSNGITASTSPFLAEPANHVTNFRSTSSNSTTITLAWSDAVGNPLPAKYLVLASTSSITPPTDGTAVYDNDLVKNVNYGVQSVSFANLAPETTYYFSIFPYTNYGNAVDYKTDQAPTLTVTTGDVSDAIVFLSEIAGRGYNGNYNDEYIEITNQGGLSASLVGYTLEYYESSLESTLSLTGIIEPYSTYIVAVRTTHSNSISPNFVPSSSFSINNPCYVVLKQNGIIIDQAGSANDKFDAKDTNFELIHCSSNNLLTSNWETLGSVNGTPGIVNCLSGIESESTEDIFIYPNPVYTTLSVNNLTISTPIEIYNLFGQKMGQYSEGTEEINVTHFPDGIYIMRLTN